MARNRVTPDDILKGKFSEDHLKALEARMAEAGGLDSLFADVNKAGSDPKLTAMMKAKAKKAAERKALASKLKFRGPKGGGLIGLLLMMYLMNKG
jgi:hypothetical protein